MLVVDDEEHILKTISRDLARAGYNCMTTNGGASAKRVIADQNEAFDVILCDLMMPEVDGLDVLRFANTQPKPAPVIILTAYGTVGAAVAAMKLGAVDFLEKPSTPEAIRAAIQLAVSRPRPESPYSSQSHAAAVPELVGSRQWLDGFKATLSRIAAADQVTVLIDGETGTGKSAVARRLHAASPRANAPFVEVNCASIPTELVESELFGHVKGAFTGAMTDKVGFVREADGGTLFLDEVGEFEHSLQSKLLTLLQERRIRPLGAIRDFTANVRFVAATNRDLEVEVRRGRFREDLYYRLNVIKLTIPPLRDRIDDIPILIEHFRKRFLQQNGKSCPQFSRDALAAMRRYEWVGNIRELENLMQRLPIMHPDADEFTVEMLPKFVQDAAREPQASRTPIQVDVGPAPPTEKQEPQLPEEGLSKAVENYQRDLLIQAVKESNGNKTQAAR
ncbi:MAG: sigma-54 dependent transcriptional regulator, partial [Myxococcota bacterium]